MPNNYLWPTTIVLDDKCENLRHALTQLKAAPALSATKRTYTLMTNPPSPSSNNSRTAYVVSEKENSLYVCVCLDLSSKFNQNNLEVMLELWWTDQGKIQPKLLVPTTAATDAFKRKQQSFSEQLIRVITESLGPITTPSAEGLQTEFIDVIPVLMTQCLQNRRIKPPITLTPWPSSPPPTLLNLSQQQVWMGVIALSCALIVISVFSFGAPAALATLAAALSISQAAAAMAIGSTALATGAGLAFAGFELFKRLSRTSLAKQSNEPLPGLISYPQTT